MTAKMRLFIVPGILMFVYMALITSCKKDNNPGIAPSLPPVESLVMDFSDFSNPDDTLSSKKSFESSLNDFEYRNWGSSFLTISFWNVLAAVPLSVPAACYAEILTHDPVYTGDNTWEWQSTYNFLFAVYKIRLTAYRISNEEFKTSMFVTQEGNSSLNDFKWLEGIIRYDHTHALWTMFDNPANPVQVLEIEWNKNWEAKTGGIRYSYIKNNTDLKGSFIEFRITDDPVYNAGYTINFKDQFTYIEWNTKEKNGHIKDSRIFGDENWHCWNGALQDINCE